MAKKIEVYDHSPKDRAWVELGEAQTIHIVQVLNEHTKCITLLPEEIPQLIKALEAASEEFQRSEVEGSHTHFHTH